MHLIAIVSFLGTLLWSGALFAENLETVSRPFVQKLKQNNLQLFFRKPQKIYGVQGLHLERMNTDRFLRSGYKNFRLVARDENILGMLKEAKTKNYRTYYKQGSRIFSLQNDQFIIDQEVRQEQIIRLLTNKGLHYHALKDDLYKYDGKNLRLANQLDFASGSIPKRTGPYDLDKLLSSAANKEGDGYKHYFKVGRKIYLLANNKLYPVKFNIENGKLKQEGGEDGDEEDEDEDKDSDEEDLSGPRWMQFYLGGNAWQSSTLASGDIFSMEGGWVPQYYFSNYWGLKAVTGFTGQRGAFNGKEVIFYSPEFLLGAFGRYDQYEVNVFYGLHYFSLDKSINSGLTFGGVYHFHRKMLAFFDWIQFYYTNVMWKPKNTNPDVIVPEEEPVKQFRLGLGLVF